MEDCHKPDFLIYQGLFFTAEWFYAADGRMSAYEYYTQMPELDQDRLDMMIRYFCDRPHGTRLPKSMYRIEDIANKIYAFKPRDERFFNFMAEGAKIIITNAYHKHSQKMAKNDLEQLKIATQYRKDYLHRLKETTYYAK